MVKMQRGRIGKRPGVEVTVKSARGLARAFAPTWPLVMDLKNGKITMVEYSQRYKALLEANVTRDHALWLSRQAEDGVVTVLCYCRDGQFCHTLLLMTYMARHYPDLFRL